MERLNYRGKVIEAPMVRVSTLPFRLLCNELGADISYSEELIDYRLASCQRVENDILHTIDYVTPDGALTFRTCDRERGKCVLQLGSAMPDRAAQVARLVQDDVDGIDVNMGCPKDYSVKGGCGAALLEDPARAESILRALVAASDRVPITCKIRVLPSEDETIAFARRVAETGIAALAVHGRTRTERSTVVKNRNDLIHRIFDILDSHDIALIANGGSIDTVRTYEDIERFRTETGAHSVMLARAALLNPAVFCRDEAAYLRQCPLLNDPTLRNSETQNGDSGEQTDKLQLEILICDFIARAIQYANPFTFTKYTVQRILREQLDDTRGAALRTRTFDATNHASNYDELVDAWRCFAPQLTTVLERYRGNNLSMAGVVLPATTDSHVTVRRSNDEPAVNDAEVACPRNASTVQENGNSKEDSEESATKRARLASDAEATAPVPTAQETVRMAVRYYQKAFDRKRTPKERLQIYCSKQRWQQPVYNTVQDAQQYFRSSVSVNGKRYESTFADKSKKSIEHAAACVCLRSLGEPDGYIGS